MTSSYTLQLTNINIYKEKGPSTESLYKLYARHYTTNAFGGCCLARTVKMLKLEAHESLIGLLELKRSFFFSPTL